ncbi:MAG: sigma-54-dependent transcriptional regulator [bacterium]
MSKNGKILLIDEDKDELKRLKLYIKKFGFDCFASKSTKKALELVSLERPNIVIADLNLLVHADNSILKEIIKFDSNILTLLYSTDRNIDSATLAFRSGAFDYLHKPISPDQLKAAIHRAMNHKLFMIQKNLLIYEKLEDVVRNYMGKKPVPSHRFIQYDKEIKKHKFGNMIGKSQLMQELFHKIIKISKSNANVMIYGESGTGKELIARSIHNCSRLRKNALIPVDCVALPENLLESELFGFEKGAFTGAESMRRGLLEYADKGTLFLDEIIELNPNLQAKLLRVLQEGEFRRVGGKQLIKVTMRVISASNIVPLEAVKYGKLRGDLYYRLNVIPLEVPPLRERKEDIPLLVDYFLHKSSHSNGESQKEFDSTAIDALMEYSWPGNVRELQNLIERLLSLVETERITAAELPEYITSSNHHDALKRAEYFDVPLLEAKKNVVENFEKEYLKQLLKKCNGNISKAANKAEISRRTLYRMIKSFNLYKQF